MPKFLVIVESPTKARTISAFLPDAVVESSVEGVRKPEPEIYRRALTRLSDAVGRAIEATDCAYLDDLGINLKPARALGFSTIKVIEPGPALAELSELVGFRLDGAA